MEQRPCQLCHPCSCPLKQTERRLPLLDRSVGEGWGCANLEKRKEKLSEGKRERAKKSRKFDLVGFDRPLQMRLDDSGAKPLSRTHTHTHSQCCKRNGRTVNYSWCPLHPPRQRLETTERLLSCVDEKSV